MALAIRLILVHGITFLLAILQVKSFVTVPVTPCPNIFNYKLFEQGWVGIVQIPSHIYNHLEDVGYITMNLTLATRQRMPTRKSIPSLKLLKTYEKTLKDIEEGNPIKYLIRFPIQNNLPNLQEIQVNGGYVCQNHNVQYAISQIHLGNHFFLKTLDPVEEHEDFDLDYDNEDSLFEQTTINPIKKTLSQKIPNLDDESIEQTPTDSQCGTYNEELKYTQLISGGQQITPGTWPWLVAIYRKTSKGSEFVFQFLCTGSLISNRLVVTAAHCFKLDSDTISPKKIMLAFGRHDIRDWTDKNMVTSDVERIILHPDYMSKREPIILDADIALLVTKNVIEYNSMIKPICLWPSDYGNKYSVIGTNGTLVGWGQPHIDIDENVPRRLNLPIVRNKSCFPSENPIRERRVFCAGNKRRGYAPCNGDSGSGFAIYVNRAWFLRGIVSAALGDSNINRCDLNTFVIFTDIIHFRTWIDDQMKDM